MKPTEKIKVQKIIYKIQKNNFDENDIDNLFMKLRAYSDNFKIFREIADFVAHNDERDRGLVNQALEHMYLRMRFFIEYQSNNKALDISIPFPSWIIKLLKYQIQKCNETELITKHKITIYDLTKKINASFSINHKTGQATYKKNKLSNQILEAASFCMSFITGQAKFSQENLIEDLIGVLKKNDINFDEYSIQINSNKITLCTLLLLHQATFSFNGYKLAKCRIASEKEEIPHNIKFVDANGKKVNRKENYGNLYIQGIVTLNKNNQDLNIAHTIMTTELDAEEWCNKNLFSIKAINERINYKQLNLDIDLHLDDDFLLSVNS